MHDNPIYKRERQRYQQQGKALNRIDTVGAVSIALILACLMLYLSIIPVIDAGKMRWNIYPALLIVGGFHLLTLLRVTIAATNIAAQVWTYENELIMISSFTRLQLIKGYILATLYQMRGWITALGILHLTLAPAAVINHQLFSIWQILLRRNYCTYILVNNEYHCIKVVGPLYQTDWWSIAVYAIGAVILPFVQVGVMIVLGVTFGMIFRVHAIAIGYTLFARLLPLILLQLQADGRLINRLTMSMNRNLFVFVDGGTMALMRWLRPFQNDENYRNINTLSYALTGVNMIVISAVVLCVVALWLSRHALARFRTD